MSYTYLLCDTVVVHLSAPRLEKVYIVDQVARARSMWLPTNGTMAVISAEDIEQRFTATQDFNLWPQAALHTQWPGVRAALFLVSIILPNV